jgi:signal transduction histidine kinase
MLARVRPAALTRAVTNLVENALKYGRRAEIALDGDAETLTVTVRDAGGSGMDAATLEALVAPFRRGANARATRGAGMGLAIVDGIARQHGGALSFADEGGGIAARLTIRRG